MPFTCKVKDCGFVAPSQAGLEEHKVRAKARHEQLALMHHAEMMKPEHKLFRHKSYLKQRKLRRAAKRAGMTPQQLAAERRAAGSSGGYKPGMGCGAGLHKWVAGASGTYWKCLKCKATRSVKRGTAVPKGRPTVRQSSKLNKRQKRKRSQRARVERT